MSSSGSNVGIETSAPLVNGIVNNALFHSNSRINQMAPQIIHILHFFLVDSMHRFDSVIKTGFRSGLFSGQKSRSSYRSLTLLHFRTGYSE